MSSQLFLFSFALLLVMSAYVSGVKNIDKAMLHLVHVCFCSFALTMLSYS